MDLTALAQNIVNGLMAGWIYVLVALGLTLVLGIMGMLQLAHGEIYMLGGYLTYYLSVILGLHYILAVILSTFLIGCLGIGIERLFFRPFRSGKFFRSVIVITGLMLVLQTTAIVSFGSQTKIMSTPFQGVVEIAGVTLSVERIIVIGVSIVFVTGLFLLISRTKIGQAIVAISQDMKAASLQGINVNHISAMVMFIGCALAAAAGALMGAIFSLSPTMGSFALMKGIAVIILGGLGSIPGAVIGGLIIGLIDGIVPPLLSTHMANLIGFLAIIIILILRPQGLMGHADTQDIR